MHLGTSNNSSHGTTSFTLAICPIIIRHGLLTLQKFDMMCHDHVKKSYTVAIFEWLMVLSWAPRPKCALQLHQTILAKQHNSVDLFATCQDNYIYKMLNIRARLQARKFLSPPLKENALSQIEKCKEQCGSHTAAEGEAHVSSHIKVAGS